MGRYLIRRLLLAIPTLLAIGFVIFAILDLAPGDPTANLPLNIPPETREQIRRALGLDEPFLIRWLKWMQLMFINEPLHVIESMFNVCIGDCENRVRVVSWAGRAPAEERNDVQAPDRTEHRRFTVDRGIAAARSARARRPDD